MELVIKFKEGVKESDLTSLINKFGEYSFVESVDIEKLKEPSFREVCKRWGEIRKKNWCDMADNEKEFYSSFNYTDPEFTLELYNKLKGSA